MLRVRRMELGGLELPSLASASSSPSGWGSCPSSSVEVPHRTICQKGSLQLYRVSYMTNILHPDKSVCPNPPYFDPVDDGDGLLHGTVHFVRNGSILHGAEVTYR